jgi:hypothetical protein
MVSAVDNPSLWVWYSSISKLGQVGMQWISNKGPFNLALLDINLQSSSPHIYRWQLQRTAIEEFLSSSNQIEREEFTKALSLVSTDHPLNSQYVQAHRLFISLSS